MANVDGDVKIRVSLDSRGAEKGADRVRRKMESLAKTVAKSFSSTARRKDIEQDIAGYEEQARAVEKTIRAEQERISTLKRLRKEVEYDPKSREIVDKMGITDLDAAIDASYNKIAAARKELKGFNADIRQSSKNINEMSEATNPVVAGLERMNKRITGLVRRVFIFSVVLRALRAMKDGLVSLLMQDSAVVKSLARIKGSLYSAFMPIYNACLPAIRSLLNFVAQLTSAIAVLARQLVNLLGGLFGISTAALSNASALGAQAGATGAAGSAAKKAAKQIAAFDEINQMSDDSSGGGGGGGGAAGMDLSGLDQVSNKMRTIAKIVLAIGAGIATWKLATALGILKDAGFLRNVGFITGAALVLWSVFDLLLPAIKSIVDEGPNIENILEAMAGIALILAGISFMTGNVGGGLLWLGIAAGALIAKNWDKITDALQAWDEKISAMVEDIPILKTAWNGLKDLAVNIKDAFVELAGIIVKIATEGFSLDILAEIGDMSFTSKAIASVVTGKLIAAIAKLIGLRGTIGIGKGFAIAMSLGAVIDIATDVIDIIKGDAEDRSIKTMELITKLLFGAMAAVITVALGGGGFALLFTIPIGIELAKTFLDRETTQQAMKRQQEYNSGKFDEAILAAQSVQELQEILQGFTNLKIDDNAFKNIIGEDVLAELTATEEGFEELQYLVLDFATLFYKQSGSADFDTWLKNLGLSKLDTTQTEASIEDIQKAHENLTGALEGAISKTQEFSDVMQGKRTDAIKNNGLVAAVESLQEGSATLETDIGSVEQAFSDAGGAAESLSLVLDEDVSASITGLETQSKDAGDVISMVFGATAQRIKTSMSDSLNGIFKSFSAGGSVFKGIETGFEAILKRIMNGLIDGLNKVLSNSFDKINSALDKVRNTQVDGIKPFISVPRVSISKIPKLAQGAVIPANREFLAILGDQKSGTNIEAPLDTIVEAVMIAMARAGMDGGNIAAAVKAAMQGLSLKVGKKEIGYVVADAINSNRRDEGKLSLNL